MINANQANSKALELLKERLSKLIEEEAALGKFSMEFNEYLPPRAVQMVELLGYELIPKDDS